MKVWLTKKLAERIDDVPLIGLHVGDTLDVATRQAELLLAEGWAALERRIKPGNAADRAVLSAAGSQLHLRVGEIR